MLELCLYCYRGLSAIMFICVYSSVPVIYRHASEDRNITWRCEKDRNKISRKDQSREERRKQDNDG